MPDITYQQRPATAHSLTAPARLAFLRGVHDLLIKVWTAQPTLTEADRNRFESALFEVVNNVVVHAPTTPGRYGVTMTVLVSCDDARLVGEVRDDGAPVHVDIEAARMPHWSAQSGRGIALARAMTDEFVYDRTVDGNHWRVTCVRGH